MRSDLLHDHNDRNEHGHESHVHLLLSLDHKTNVELREYRLSIHRRVAYPDHLRGGFREKSKYAHGIHVEDSSVQSSAAIPRVGERSNHQDAPSTGSGPRDPDSRSDLLDQSDPRRSRNERGRGQAEIDPPNANIRRHGRRLVSALVHFI